MGKTIFIVLVAITTALSSLAQSKFKPEIRVGLNNATITNLNSTNDTGFFLGLVYPVKIGKNKTMRIELTYEKLITKSNQLIDLDINSNKIEIDFITASLSFKVLSKKDFYVLTGPFISVLTSQNFSQFTPGFIDLTPNIDFGVFAGVGYNFFQNFNAELRYKIGFEDVILQREDSSKNQTRMFQLGITYKFNLKK